MSAITSPAMQFVGNMTGLAADLAGGVSHVVSSYLPHALKPSNATMSSHPALPTTPAWTWAKYASLLVAVSYLSDFMAKRYRDKRLRKFGASAPLIPYKMPLGIDLAIYSLYRFFRFTFFELVCTWLAAVPGHTVEARMFATGLIFTEEPANIKAIMSSNWSNFGRGEVTKRIWGDMLGSTQIFVVDGEDWHRSKERIKDHVMAMRSTDLEITEKHTKNLFDLFDIWKPIEVYDAIDRYQLDVVTDVFFGETANSLTSRHPFKGPMETLHPINTARMLFGKNAYYVKDKYIAPKALADLNAYTRGVTDRAYARDLSKKAREDYTLLDDLVSQNKSYEDIKEAIMSIMLGGKDPSAILISWAIFMMGTHPNVMKKMKAEVAQVCGGKLPSAANLREMTYVKHVINECFRLYHPLGLNVRVALNDTSLPAGGGASGNEPLAVAKGTTIIYSLGGLQRRKDIYGDDAHEFRPERWEGANVNRWHFIPYNHGPRHCLGQKFGQQQMEYVLARICQEYEAIRIPPGQPKQQIRVELNLKMAHPCKVIFVRKHEEDMAAANANWLE